MNKFKKALALICCAVLLVCISIGATIAYLTSTTEVAQNTFTVGDVEITLDEAPVNEEGVVQEGNRVTSNEYKLMPGHVYVKDPTVHVQPDSEESYIRMVVTIKDIEDVKNIIGKYETASVVDGKFLPQYLVEGWDNGIWKTTGVITEANNAATYEFRYYKTVSTEDSENVLDLEPLFTKIKVPGGVTNEELAKLEELEINIIAHAIQADTFNGDENAAWTAFGAVTPVEPTPAPSADTDVTNPDDTTAEG